MPSRMQLVIQKRLMPAFMYMNHDHIFAGHIGFDKTYAKISHNYFWFRKFSDVFHNIQEYVRSCMTCTSRKLQQLQTPLQETPIHSSPCHIVVIDILGPLPKSTKGNEYLLAFHELYTAWPEAYPIPDKTSITIADIILTEFILRHGVQ